MRVLLFVALAACTNADGHLNQGTQGAIFVERQVDFAAAIDDDDRAALASTFGNLLAAFTSSGYAFEDKDTNTIARSFEVYTTAANVAAADDAAIFDSPFSASIEGATLNGGSFTYDGDAPDAATLTILETDWGLTNGGTAGGWVLKKDTTQASLVEECGLVDDAVLSLWLQIAAVDVCNHPGGAGTFTDAGVGEGCLAPAAQVDADACAAATAVVAELQDPVTCVWSTQAEGAATVQASLDTLVHEVAANNPGTVSYAGYKQGDNTWQLREIYSNSINFEKHLGNYTDGGFAGDFATAIVAIPTLYWSGYQVTADNSDNQAGLSAAAWGVTNGVFGLPVAKAHGNLLNKSNFAAGTATDACDSSEDDADETPGSGSDASSADMLSGIVALFALLL